MTTQQSPSTKKASKPKAPPKGSKAAAPEEPPKPASKTVRVSPEVAAVLLGTTKLEGGLVEITVEQREAERRHEEHERRKQTESDNAMAFAVQQMTAPAVPNEPPAAALQKYNDELAKLQETYGIKPAEPAPKSGKIVRNGVTRPGPDTITGKVWAVSDRITVQQGRPAMISEVRLDLDLRGVNDHTIKTQYARWREFNDVRGRLQATSAKVMTHDGNP